MNFLSKLPKSMVAVTVVMAALGPLVFVLGSSSGLMTLWMSVYLAVGVIAGLGAFFVERSQNEKVKDFSKSVEQNAASVQGVKDPRQLAENDHMHKEFQRGIEIYKRYGKDLYSLPWYVVVGESGAGKTEALRRSEIGFPEKLQDKWQGSGGTLSMHWWFTNRAVILDTAGRLFVQDGAESSKSQWIGFLRMLRRNRPDCPINGLILVIPATRLLAIEDPAEEANSLTQLDQNAGQIAAQMETLQTELGIRFPVYIVISKTDKIPGFREFFAGVEGADERYQMLGWSNPGALGEAFNPQSVSDYIQSVSERLKRRMMTMLRNPEPAEPTGLRIDEVDSVYAFPSAFAGMSAKLTRYLRHVFATDEWSSKPPFLRGIYFTSALQQGRVLDEAMARALGMPMEQFEGGEESSGLGLARHKTYFLRDLFLEKIFREKGLITGSDKVPAAIKGWKLWVPAAIIAWIAVMGVIGFLTSGDVGESKDWRKLYDCKEESGRLSRILDLPENEAVWMEPNSETNPLPVLEALQDPVSKSADLGWHFVVARMFDEDLNFNREETYSRAVLDVTWSVVETVKNRMKKDFETAEPRNDKSSRALRALVFLYHGNLSIGEKGELMVEVEGSKAEFQADFQSLMSDLIAPYSAEPEEAAGPSSPISRLGSLVVTALKLRKQSDFDSDLNLRRGEPELKELIEMHQGKSGDFASSLNQLAENYRTLLDQIEEDQAKPAQIAELSKETKDLLDKYPKELNGLAAAATKPKRKRSIASDEEDSKLSDELAKILEALPEDYSDLDSGPKISPEASEFAAGGAKGLEKILGAFSPDGGDGFTLDELDQLNKHVAAPDPKDEADRDEPPVGVSDEDLNSIRKWWLREVFFKTDFKKYLGFPFVKDGSALKEDESKLAVMLIELAEKVELRGSNFQNLNKVANALFDPETKPKSVTITPQKPEDLVSRKVSLKVVDGNSFVFNTRAKELMQDAVDIPLMAAIEVTYNDSSNPIFPGEKTRSWSLIHWYLRNSNENTRNIIKVGNAEEDCLLLEIPELKDLPRASEWPSLKDF